MIKGKDKQWYSMPSGCWKDLNLRTWPRSKYLRDDNQTFLPMQDLLRKRESVAMPGSGKGNRKDEPAPY